MGSFGPIHWIILIAIILLLFGGRGKISELMGDFAKGIRSFRQGLKDDTRTIDDKSDTKKDDAVKH